MRVKRKMSFEFKGKALVLSFIYIELMARCSAENTEKNLYLLNEEKDLKTSEYILCSKTRSCLCHPGITDENGVRTLYAGENERCTKKEDCCGVLQCINGICRKEAPNIELITLVKVCLGITVTALIVGIFGAIIKCLIRYDRLRAFQRNNDSWSMNSALTRTTCTNSRQVLNAQDSLFEIQEEKPPSYEECVESREEKQSARQPPPYVIYKMPSTENITQIIKLQDNTGNAGEPANQETSNRK